jgi:3-ketosteroid 9alpha-monooxygenase subunit A
MTDAEVWKFKRPALIPMQLPGDGPFRQSRVWYSQFYNPRARAGEIVGRVAGVHYSKNWPPFTAEAAE